MEQPSREEALADAHELGPLAGGQPPPLFREALNATIAGSIAAGRSVLLVGPSGVGKTALVYELARRLATPAPRRLYELTASGLLAGTKYLGEWQTKVTDIFNAVARSRAVLYFSDIANIKTTGSSSTATHSIWDVLRPRLLRREIQVIAEVSDEQLLALRDDTAFLAPFDIVEVPPLSADQCAAIVRAEAERIGVGLEPSSAARLLELCQQFLPTAAGPGPALRFLAQIKDYQNEKRGIGEDEAITPAFVEKVFSVYTGLPRFVVSRQQVRPVAEIRDWFQARIVGQRTAIDAIVQMITLFKAGLHDAGKPIGSFLFVGPTGVGKTELARALASYLFGSENRLLRFDLSEFKDYHSFQLLIGDPYRPERPARLADPVRAQPFQVVLLDEIEKAHSNVWDLLLQVLDEGHLTPARGPAVNFRNTIVIATANVGAASLDKRPIGFTGGAEAADAHQLQADLEAVFRPELLNRFQNIVRFSRLTRDEVKAIARAELRRILEREGIIARRLAVDVDGDVLDLVVERGYDERYGARALKRELQQLVIMPIATLLMERTVEDGSILRLTARSGEVRIAVVDSAESRMHRLEHQPLRLADGRKIAPEDLRQLANDGQQRLTAIETGVDLAALKARRQDLETTRRGVDIWKDAEATALLLNQCVSLDGIIGRLARLQERQSDLQQALAGATQREGRLQLARRLQRHLQVIEVATRELLILRDAGRADALLEIRPIGRARPARDLLYETYCAWAEHRKHRVLLVREPMADDEPVMMAIRGPYAYGYLRLECGHHRVRAGQNTHVARVGVAPIGEIGGHMAPRAQRALKQVGQFGGKIRSRVEVGQDFVIQNGRTLTENRELAEELAPSWVASTPAGESIVRRYDLDPFLVRDILTDLSSGRRDILQPESFHDLLSRRVDKTGAAETPP